MNYLEKLFNIKNKVIVITGGTGILGSKISKGFLDAGAKVVLLGTNQDKLNRKIKAFKKSEGEVSGFVTTF
jgi:NADP-dependent 3-hydroxy acid dehydrogenase YdfG